MTNLLLAVALAGASQASQAPVWWPVTVTWTNTSACPSNVLYVTQSNWSQRIQFAATNQITVSNVPKVQTTFTVTSLDPITGESLPSNPTFIGIGGPVVYVTNSYRVQPAFSSDLLTWTTNGTISWLFTNPPGQAGFWRLTIVTN